MFVANVVWGSSALLMVKEFVSSVGKVQKTPISVVGIMLILLIFQTITTITQLAKRLLSSILGREFHKVFYFAPFVEDSLQNKSR